MPGKFIEGLGWREWEDESDVRAENEELKAADWGLREFIRNLNADNERLRAENERLHEWLAEALQNLEYVHTNHQTSGILRRAECIDGIRSLGIEPAILPPQKR